jgi:hypothetical protein
MYCHYGDNRCLFSGVRRESASLQKKDPEKIRHACPDSSLLGQAPAGIQYCFEKPGFLFSRERRQRCRK